jgi:hypothetical protein
MNIDKNNIVLRNNALKEEVGDDHLANTEKGNKKIIT